MTPETRIQSQLGEYQNIVSDALRHLDNNQVIQRIWDHDHTVWHPEPDEISNRLGWLHCVENYRAEIDRLIEFASNVRADGYTDVRLLGMGGSSLAPEVFSLVYGMTSDDSLNLAIIDSTDPDMILKRTDGLDLTKTLFIVATKSGGTVETLSAFKYFYNLLLKLMSPEEAGRHFVAITDPGSKLVEIAEKFDFRDIFLNDPNIGGRYSALSFFGLVPAALVGVDLAKLLDRAKREATDRSLDSISTQLGAKMGALANQGRDKITIIAPQPIASFGDWAEQLIAESTGKSGKGIVPIVGEPLGPPAVYDDDRFFVYLKLAGDESQAEALTALAEAGHPVMTILLDDIYDLGGQLFAWEMAVAVAGHLIGIQPFDQPNVESAKVLARSMVSRYMDTGSLPDDEAAELSKTALDAFLADAQPGDYVSIHAYVEPTAETELALQDLRVQVRDRLKLATTVGYGPRFLHSTGQLHKGDDGSGLFIQLTSTEREDVPIPDEAGQELSTMSFAVLKKAQALGDAQALRDEGRRIISFQLSEHAEEDIRALLE